MVIKECWSLQYLQYLVRIKRSYMYMSKIPICNSYDCRKTWFLNVSTKQNIFPYRAHYIEFKTTDNLFWQGCPDTLKWWGASLVFQPGDGVRTLFAICSQFNFTQENNKLSNKNVGANSLHPPLDLEPLFWRLYISHFSSEDYEK